MYKYIGVKVLCPEGLQFLGSERIADYRVNLFTRNRSPCLSSPDVFAESESPLVTHSNPIRNALLVGWWLAS